MNLEKCHYLRFSQTSIVVSSLCTIKSEYTVHEHINLCTTSDYTYIHTLYRNDIIKPRERDLNVNIGRIELLSSALRMRMLKR